MNKNRILTLLACILLCAAIASSLTFIAVESHHDCIEYDCQICLEIQSCKTFLYSISHTPAALFFFLPFLCRTLLLYRSAVLRNKAVTLITLKVKLSN